MESSNNDIANDSMTLDQCEETIESLDEIYRTYNESRNMQIGRTSSGTLTPKNSQNDVFEENEGNNINNNDNDKTAIENISNSQPVEYDAIETERDNKIAIAMASKPFAYTELEDFRSRELPKSLFNRLVSGQMEMKHQSATSTTTYSNGNKKQHFSLNELRPSRNSVRFADENINSGTNTMSVMSAYDYYTQQLAMANGGLNMCGYHPQARAGPGSGGYQYPADETEMFNRSQYMNIPSQSDSASGCNNRHQYDHQPPVNLQHRHERKESGESSSVQHMQQDSCSEASTVQSGDYTSQSCVETSNSCQDSCIDTCNASYNDTCSSPQNDCSDRSDKQSCNSRFAFPKMNSMPNGYSSQDCMESMGYSFCDQNSGSIDQACCSYPSEYFYGAPIPLPHCAQSSPMTYVPQQRSCPCHSAPYCWPMQSCCAPVPAYCPMSRYATPPVCMPPTCCPQQADEKCSICAKDAVNIQTIYGTDYRGICGNQFNHFPNTGSCGICTNCSACMGIVGCPCEDGPETRGPCKGCCIFSGTNGYCSMSHPTSSCHQMLTPMSSGCSQQMSPCNSQQMSPCSSHQISPVSSHQVSPSLTPVSSHQMAPTIPYSTHEMSTMMLPNNISNPHFAGGASGLPLHSAPSWPAQAYEMPEDGGYTMGQPIYSRDAPISTANSCDLSKSTCKANEPQQV